MIVLLDCDGVLADFTGAIVDELNDRLGTKFRASDATSYDFAKCFGLSDSEVYKIAGIPGFCSGIRPILGAVTGVRRLMDRHKVYVVTSPIIATTWMYERTQWLADHFGIDRRHVIHTSAKERVHGDVMVDDKPENLERWKRQWPDGRALLYNQRWNSTYKQPPIVRVCTWKQVADFTATSRSR